MKAMILAAGLGKRMRPLTNNCPKPLLKVLDKPLIVYHIEKLQQAGFTDIVINTSYLADIIHQSLGDGSQFGVRLHFSYEGETALETGGGIFKALPLLGEDFFLVINGDVFCDYPLEKKIFNQNQLAHLILVNNPAHNLKGDFGLENNIITNQPDYTFSGIGYYHANFFKNCKPGIFPLAPLLREYIEKQQVTGELFTGTWIDVGTPERLQQLQEYIKKGA